MKKSHHGANVNSECSRKFCTDYHMLIVYVISQSGKVDKKQRLVTHVSFKPKQEIELV